MADVSTSRPASPLLLARLKTQLHQVRHGVAWPSPYSASQLPGEAAVLVECLEGLGFNADAAAVKDDLQDLFAGWLRELPADVADDRWEEFAIQAEKHFGPFAESDKRSGDTEAIRLRLIDRLDLLRDAVNRIAPQAEQGAADVGYDYHVTLTQAAAIVHKQKRTLERWAKEDGDFPLPTVQGAGGKSSLWSWGTLRPYLAQKTGLKLPERFPGDTFHPDYGAIGT